MSQKPPSSQPPRRVTMREIAAVADCSLMTVSRALRNDPGVAVQTRKRVHEQAERLGYRPDPELSRLMRHLHPDRILEPETIACLNLHPDPDHWQQSLLGKAIVQGAQENARSNGYQLSHFWLGDHKMSAPRFADVLRHRGIRGLFIPPVPPGTTALEKMPWAHLAVATCGYSLYSPSLHRACSHQYQAVRLAWQQLRQRGYRRIGLILHPIGTRSPRPALIAGQADGNHNHHMWLSGFIACQSEERLNRSTRPARSESPSSHRNENRPAAYLPPLSIPPSAASALAPWIRKHRPDAIIGHASVLPFLQAMGLEIPATCAFAALNIIDAPAHVCGVDHHMDALGAAAIDLIIEQLSFHRFGLPAIAKSVLVECEWRQGSTAPSLHTGQKRPKMLR